jgi:hypothetical protein
MSSEWEKYRARTASNEQMVYDYFRLIDKKDLDGLLELFADDATVYEPFSQVEDGLKGKAAIRDFLHITIMADAGTKRTVEFVNGAHIGRTEKDIEMDEIAALVTFQGDGTLRGKFNFKFVIVVEVIEDRDGVSMLFPSKKIKELRIQISD